MKMFCFKECFFLFICMHLVSCSFNKVIIRQKLSAKGRYVVSKGDFRGMPYLHVKRKGSVKYDFWIEFEPPRPFFSRKHTFEGGYAIWHMVTDTSGRYIKCFGDVLRVKPGGGIGVGDFQPITEEERGMFMRISKVLQSDPSTLKKKLNDSTVSEIIGWVRV